MGMDRQTIMKQWKCQERCTDDNEKESQEEMEGKERKERCLKVEDRVQ